jgi:hypothetical protein
MLVVMLGLLVLTVVAATYVDQGSDVTVTSTAVSGQRFASARAEEGAQLAIARIKAGGFPTILSLPACTGPTTAIRTGTCAPGDMFTTFFEAPGPAATGGGWQFQYWIYRPNNVLADGGSLPQSVQLFHVYAEGYFGSGDAGVASFTVSAVEAEVVVPRPPGLLPCFDGDYGLIGC